MWALILFNLGEFYLVEQGTGRLARCGGAHPPSHTLGPCTEPAPQGVASGTVGEFPCGVCGVLSNRQTSI